MKWFWYKLIKNDLNEQIKDTGQPLLQILWNMEKARNVNILKAFMTVRKHVLPSQNT